MARPKTDKEYIDAKGDKHIHYADGRCEAECVIGHIDHVVGRTSFESEPLFYRHPHDVRLTKMIEL